MFNLGMDPINLVLWITEFGIVALVSKKPSENLYSQSAQLIPNAGVQIWSCSLNATNT